MGPKDPNSKRSKAKFTSAGLDKNKNKISKRKLYSQTGYEFV